MKAANQPLSALMRAFRKTLMTTMGVTVVGFISSVVGARILGPEGRGLLSAALLICSLSASLAQCGLGRSYVYHFGAARHFPYLRLLVWSLIGVSVLSAGLSVAGLQLSHTVQLHQVWWLLLTFAAFTACQAYIVSLTQLHANLHFFNVLRWAHVFGNLILMLSLLLWFRVVTFEHVFVVQLTVLVGVTGLGMWWARQHRVWQLNIEVKEPPVPVWSLVRYGLQHHGIVLLGIFLNNFDKLVLLNRGSIKEFGFYTMAFTTSRLIGAVQGAISVALFSRFAGRDEQQLSLAVRKAFRATFLPLMGMAAIGAALAPWALTLVYGEAFAAMAVPFAILLFECVIGGASWTLAQRFKPGLMLVRQLVSILPVLVAIPFLPHENSYVYLAFLMLCGAVLRLTTTLLLWVTLLKEPMPQFLPTKNDLNMVRQVLTHWK